MGPASAAEPPRLEYLPDASPSNWREALMGLISSRLAIIELEAKEAAAGGARRAVFVLIVLGCAFFAWALLVTGVIALVAETSRLHLSWIILGAGLLHVLVALIFAKLAKPSKNPAFPVTRAEFLKDREWIENFQKPKKSND